MSASVAREDLKSTPYEFFILAVSVLSIVNLALMSTISFRSQAWWLIAYVDTGLTLIFLGDFTYRLKTASNRRRYMWQGRGIFDLLGSLPGFRIFRLFRIIRAIHIVRRLGGPQVLRELRAGFATGVLYLVIFVGIFVLEFVGLLELHFEQNAPGGNITTGGDALWWGYVTATTVGYGDYYPVTPGGRIAGLFMLTIGVGLFATFSGFLANAFLSIRRSEPKRPTRDGDLQSALGEVERLLAEQQQATAALRSRLAELEPTR